MPSSPPIKKADHLDTLAKGLALLRLFSSEVTELTIQDAAECLSLSRAAARRFMMTLESLGYLERNGRAFRMTPEVLKLGYSYFSSTDLPSIAAPIIKSLVEQIDESCGLCVLHGDDVVYLGGIASKKAFTLRIHNGTFLPAYPTAAGRVLLGGLEDSALEAYLQRVKFVPLTPYTVSNVNDLRRAINKARKAGYSVVANELAYGSCGMAVPILNGEDQMQATLYMGLQHGQNPNAMALKYLPHLKKAAAELTDIVRKTTGLPS